MVCGTFSVVRHVDAPDGRCVWQADPTEHVDLALEQPRLVRELYARLEAYSKTLFDPHRGDVETNASCAQMVKNKGFFGPWLTDAEARARHLP